MMTNLSKFHGKLISKMFLIITSLLKNYSEYSKSFELLLCMWINLLILARKIKTSAELRAQKVVPLMSHKFDFLLLSISMRSIK